MQVMKTMTPWKTKRKKKQMHKNVSQSEPLVQTGLFQFYLSAPKYFLF